MDLANTSALSGRCVLLASTRVFPGGLEQCIFFWLEPDLAANQAVVGVTVGTLIGACNEHISEIAASCDDQV